MLTAGAKETHTRQSYSISPSFLALLKDTFSMLNGVYTSVKIKWFKDGTYQRMCYILCTLFSFFFAFLKYAYELSKTFLLYFLDFNIKYYVKDTKSCENQTNLPRLVFIIVCKLIHSRNYPHHPGCEYAMNAQKSLHFE